MATKSVNIRRMKKAQRHLEQAREALEPFGWTDDRAYHGMGFHRLRPEMLDALNTIDRQLDKKEGWMLTVE